MNYKEDAHFRKAEAGDSGGLVSQPEPVRGKESPVSLRRARIEDIEELVRLRKCQLQDEGQERNSDMDQSLPSFFYEKMAGEELVQWVAEDPEGRIIATAGIIIMDFPPTFVNPLKKIGYVANVYTADAWRGRGIAGLLLSKLEEEARARGIIRMLLHASEMGIRAYRKSGFHKGDQVMEKTL